MSNFSINLLADANTVQARTEIAKLHAQVNALNDDLLKVGRAPRGTARPDMFAKMQKDVATASRTAKLAAQSTGLWEASQLNLRSATEEYTEALQRQRVSLREWQKSQKLATAAYKEQLRLQSTVAHQLPLQGPGGKQVYDVYTPKQYNKELDTMAQRIGFARENLRSFSTQMINWGKNTQWAGRQLMVGFTLPVVAFGAAAGVAAYQVDMQLTRIAKVYDTTAQAVAGSQMSMIAVDKELAQVREAGLRTAEKAARDYASAAADTLDVQAELAATGLKGARLQGATNEVMRIATLGELDRATAIESTIALQSVFRMSNRELTKSFNYMNAVENATSLQTKDFAAAIPIAAAPIKAFGGDIYELGVLMTAMKERGIEASQGANALKAAMQRLGRPSKIIREEFTELTGQDITKIVKDSDSLTEILQKIGAAVEGLPKADRIKVIAGLFGSWQVTRFDAMIQGLKDVKDGVGQAGKAFQIAQKDPANWAAAADTELKRFQESASFRFKAAFETLKLEMAEAGKPFLAFGAAFMKMISFIVKGFNALPGPLKLLMAMPIVILAIAGPLIMLTGLIANFAGNAMKFGVALTGVLGKMELLNRESTVAKKAAELAADGMINEAQAVNNLTRHFEMLAVAMAKAHKIPLDTITPAISAGGMTAAQMEAAGVRYNSAGKVVWAAHDVEKGRRKGSYVSQADLKAMREEQELLKDAAKDQKIVENSSKTTKKHWGGTATNVALAVGSLAMLSGTADGAEQKFINIAITAALFGPLFAAGAGKLKEMVKWIFAAEGSTSKWSLSGTNLKNGFFSALSKGKGLLNPWVLGLTAIVGLTIGIKEAAENSLERQQRLTSSAKDWADQVGAVYTGYKRLSNLPMGGETTTSMYNKGQKFKETQFGSDIVNELNSYGGSNRSLFALTEYNKMLETTSMTSKQAKENIQLMFFAAYKDPYQAVAAYEDFTKVLDKNNHSVLKSTEGVMGLGDSMNSLKNINTQITQAMSSAASAGDQLKKKDMGFLGMKFFYEAPKTYIESWGRDEEKIAAEKGKNIAASLAEGMASLKNPFEKAQYFKSFQKVLMDQWNSVYSKIDSELRDKLASVGIDTGAKLFDAINLARQGYNAFGAKYKADNPMEQNSVYDAVMNIGQIKGAKELLGVQSSITKELQAQGVLGQAAANIFDATLGSGYKIVDLNKKTLKYNFMQAVQRGRLNDAQQLSLLNQMRINAGLSTTSNLADMFNEKTKTGNKYIDERNSKINETNRLMSLVKGQPVWDFAKETMSSLQQSMADAELSRFDSRMNSAMDAVEAAGQARMDALEKRSQAAQDAMESRHQNQQDALEERQKRREKRIEAAYDSRIAKVDQAIKAEQKAEEIRQKIFDAESKRLDRWAEMANRNIDFNVAMNSGNLDEAAKIRNEGVAATSQWALDDAADSGKSRSDAKVERLEKRKDAIEKARDAELEAIKKVEDQEKKALQRRQDREKKALQNRLDAERDALQKSVDATRKAEQAKWDSRRDYLQRSLEDFTRYVARDAKDLRKHIKLWKDEHKGLSNDTRRQFNISTDQINSYLVNRMKQSRRAIVNDLDWQASGKKMAADMIQGAFGMNLQQFRRWMITGEYPAPKKNKTSNKTVHVGSSGTGAGGRLTPYHTGGWIGGRGGRNGVARTNPLHPSETIINARKGEFMVNSDAAEKHGSLLEAINSGKRLGPTGPVNNNGARGTDAPLGKNQGGFSSPAMGSAALGFSGLMLAAAAQAIVGGIRQGAEAGAATAVGKGGSFAPTRAGEFAGIGLTAAQIRNAVTIANTGMKLGASPRDIKIALITAMQESGLRNLNYGDRDSVGLFQQRSAWGSFNDRTDPVKSATMFFKGGQAGQRGLFDFPNRGKMSMTEAAQAVQVSAFPSAYAKWVTMVNALYSAIHRGANGLAGYMPGTGGKHRPISQPVSRGLHDQYTGFPAVDMAAPVGTPVHAVADGRITKSFDLKGFEPRNAVQNGYRSYGRVIYQSVPGGEVLYAHLSRRSVHEGQRVKGGAIIGATGNTGHSTGPHLHFGARGVTPYAFLREGGIVKQDGTLSVLHKDEGVLTAPLTNTLTAGIGGISEAGQVLEEIRRSGLSQGAYDNSRVGQVSGYKYGKPGNGRPGQGGGSNGVVRIASFNVHAYGHSNAKSISDLMKILPRTDALALQENTSGAVRKWITQHGFGLHQGPTGTGIAWRNSKFKASRFGNWDLNKKYKMPAGTSQRYVPYGLMTDKASGKKFWLGSAHLIPNEKYYKGRVSAPLRNAILNEQYQRMAMLENKLDNTAPVVFGGDYNDRRGNRFKDLRSSGHKGIDKIYASLARSGKASTIGKLFSDHNAVLQSYKLPGLSTGGFTLNEGIARLHKKETVLTAPLSEKLNLGIDRLATGVGNTYNLHMYGFDGQVDENVLANKVVRIMRREEGRKANSRSTN